MLKLLQLGSLVLATCWLTTIGYAAPTVGTTAAVNPQALGTPPGGAPRTLVLGNDVVFKERIDTSGEGLVQVLLVDGTTLTVGPGSRLIIDEYVYDPSSGTGKLVLDFARGAMRFVGGKLSKKEAAVIRTPPGALGIRGGIANFVLEGDQSCWVPPKVNRDKNCRAIFSLLFGKELSFDGRDGTKERIYKQGYTLEISSATGGKPHVRRMQASDSQIIQKKLAGKPGATGGAKEQPTDTTVSESNLPESNSETAPQQYAQTDPTPPPGSQEPPVDISEATADSTADNTTGAETFTPRNYQVRVLTPPEPVFDVSFLPPGEDPSDPGSLGLVGGTNDPDADIVVSAERISASTMRVCNSTDCVVVPYTDVPGTYNVNFTDFDGNEQTGTMFIGQNADFLFYATFTNGNVDSPNYAFAGVATPASALLGQDRLRIYDLQADPRQGISMPFILADLVPNAQAASVSQLYVMEPNGVPLGDDSNHQATGASTVLLGGLLISGQGVNQTSAVSVLAGRFVEDVSGPAFFTSRRGSVRISSVMSSLSSGGGLSTVPSPGGAHVFGPDANNFILSSNFSIGDVFGGSVARNEDFETFKDNLYFSTIHVGKSYRNTGPGDTDAQQQALFRLCGRNARIASVK